MRSAPTTKQTRKRRNEHQKNDNSNNDAKTTTATRKQRRWQQQQKQQQQKQQHTRIRMINKQREESAAMWSENYRNCLPCNCLNRQVANWNTNTMFGWGLLLFSPLCPHISRLSRWGLVLVVYRGTGNIIGCHTRFPLRKLPSNHSDFNSVPLNDPKRLCGFDLDSDPDL